ncbi:olfactory receptor 2B6-like [Alligator mississippiensis]|uniref:olfactory receptor 2B6-like n=1 Tax=Alligator mississippiensis TaxID=8496 RepID=UPI002877B134|nr:olfactory receptor 2B6-like [Alligator mississippiensis]XP_059576189.1 olfactory receptor 2B6-like [Alligator mississippiensis]
MESKVGKRNHSMGREVILLGISDQRELQWLVFVVFSLVYAVTVLGNLTIITLASLDSQLHTPMYFFLSNLAFLNLCYVSIVVPKMLTNILTGSKSISYELCAAQVCITLFLGSTEYLILMVMAFDLYVAICNPLRYNTVMDRRVCINLAAASWAIGILATAIPSPFLWPVLCGPNVINHFFCETPALVKLSCADTSSTEKMMFIGGFFTLMFPLFLVLISYIGIIRAILKIGSAVGRKKAFSTCSSHMTVVTIFYGTGMFMYMQPQAQHSPDKDEVVSVFYAVLNPMLNPLIYSLRNREVKGALGRVLQRYEAFTGTEMGVSCEIRFNCAPYKTLGVRKGQDSSS